MEADTENLEIIEMFTYKNLFGFAHRWIKTIDHSYRPASLIDTITDAQYLVFVIVSIIAYIKRTGYLFIKLINLENIYRCL